MIIWSLDVWLKAFTTHYLSSGHNSKFGPDKAVQCSEVKVSAVQFTSLYCKTKESSLVKYSVVLLSRPAASGKQRDRRFGKILISWKIGSLN